MPEDGLEQGIVRTAPQKWIRGRLAGKGDGHIIQPCKGCGCSEADHAYPLDPSVNPADLAKDDLRPVLVATRWPPGTTRAECMLRGCGCRKYVPGEFHRDSAEKRKKVLRVVDPHSGPLPAYARRNKGPRAWDVDDAPRPAAGLTHAAGGMG